MNQNTLLCRCGAPAERLIVFKFNSQVPVKSKLTEFKKDFFLCKECFEKAKTMLLYKLAELWLKNPQEVSRNEEGELGKKCWVIILPHPSFQINRKHFFKILKELEFKLYSGF